MAASNRTLHVSPAGSSHGDGSPSKPLDIRTALKADGPTKPGDTLALAAGKYDGPKQDGKRVPFEISVSGEAGAPVVVRSAGNAPAHLNGKVRVTGSHVHCIGLEIGDLEWDPVAAKDENDAAVLVESGEGAKVINCNLFGALHGFRSWLTVANAEVYGCLIHDFGERRAVGRGHGNGHYANGCRSSHLLKHSIVYRGACLNVHEYGAHFENLSIVENISYIAAAQKPGKMMDSYLIVAFVPSKGLRLIGNVGYQPLDTQPWRPNARLVSYRNVMHTGGEVRDNYLMGAYYGLSLGRWKDMTVTGNTVWATGIFMEISSAPTGTRLGDQKRKPPLVGYLVDRNTYIDNGQARPFVYGAKDHSESRELPPMAERLSFAEWRALGLDTRSTVVSGDNGRPTGTKVFVFPNEYEAGRGNVAVFNWDGLDAVNVDLSSVMSDGQRFKVYNCLDINQTLAQTEPVLEGTYGGTPVSFPMRKAAVSPDFDAFLVVPLV